MTKTRIAPAESIRWIPQPRRSADHAGARQARPPRIWKFWGTALWGLFIFTALFVGQIVVVAWLVLRRDGPIDIAAAIHVLGSGMTISLSVITGLPAALGAIWLATRLSRTPFADYLALRWTSWRNLALGVGALIVLVGGWDLLSRALGREIAPGFMVDVLKSAQADGALWLLVIAFCVAAPVSEEFFARGFLYRGWSESLLRVPGAILLSSLVWTALHLQYRLVLFRRGVFDRAAARLAALSQQLDLADSGPARPQQFCGDAAEQVAGGAGVGSYRHCERANAIHATVT